MKQSVIYIGIIGYIFFFLFLGCADEYREGEGEGRLYLAVSVSDKIDVAISKADSGNEWNPADDCKIAISSSAGVIQRYEGVQSLPEEIWLVSGNYSVAVTAGDSVPAGFSSPYYKGSQNFTILTGKVSQATVDCYLANTLVTPYYSEDFKKNMTSFQLIVSNTGGSLTFDLSKEGISGYYMMSESAKNLTWEFKGISTDGEEIKKTGTIPNAKARTNYKVNIDFDPSYSDGGGVLIGIEVDDTYSDINEDNVGIVMPPSISGQGFDIDATLIRPEGSLNDIKIWINGASELKSALFSMDASVQQKFGLPTNQFDFISMDAATKQQFSSVYKFDCKEQSEDRDGDGVDDVWRMLITISGETMLEFEKDYTFSMTIVAEDANGYRREKVLTVETTDSVILTEDVEDYMVWTNRATLTGRIIVPVEGTISFQYRKINDLYYDVIDAEVDGEYFSVELKALDAGQTYEYRAIVGDNFGDTKFFTTESANQLPNSNFENWQKPGYPWLIYGNGEALFWDSGNKGSASSFAINTNVTTPSEMYAHEKYCAQLKSQAAGISGIYVKFAAGNLFAGEFGELVGTNGAKLNWGQPFTTRPSKLKIWYRYESGVIDYDDNKLTQELKDEGAVLGQKDKAHIYIALGDWGAPIQIDNSKRPDGLFDKQDPHIIAYGELVIDDSTNEDILISHEINIEYVSLVRIPTHVIVVCTSSKYGDYFTGSTGSTLWLDDFELIYE